MDCLSNGEGVVPLWSPNLSKKTRIDQFRETINYKYNLSLDNYDDLWIWSVDKYKEFWETFWDFSKLIHSKIYTEVIDTSKNISEIPKWFIGSRLNFAENLLKYDDNRTALFVATEGKTDHIIEYTFHELREQVGKYSAAMRKIGIKENDRVVGYIPNCAQTIFAALAAASIGAIWSSTSPDFGVNGVLDRFSQIRPRLIFSVDAVVYNGKTHDHLDKLSQVCSQLADLERVVVIPYVAHKNKINISNISNSVFLEEFLEIGKDEKSGKYPPLEFSQLPFDHPLYIMYSSGTTDAPKCMVHSAGGTLIKHLEEHMLQGNMTKDDIIIYYTTTGWMMWNWMISALALGSALVLYDGSPLVPSPNVLWDLVDHLGITVLGTGAKWLAVLEDKGVKPGATHNLKTLHSILSTGSPLRPTSYDYVYRDIKHNLLLGSITGGTDIIGCFAGQNHTLPVYRGELQCRFLGMAIESWNENGPIYEESGELVCSKPFPSMPTHFWNDPEGVKYKKAYFSKFRGVWAHGDFCQINSKTRGIVMLGRSDGTLNPNGVRFGSSELYNIAETMPEIQDSLAVSQYNKDLEERVIFFIKMAHGHSWNQELVSRLKTAIRANLSIRHMPSLILETKDIPYTISGKKVEVAIKRILQGEDIQARGAFQNPESLDLYYNIPELQNF